MKRNKKRKVQRGGEKEDKGKGKKYEEEEEVK